MKGFSTLAAVSLAVQASADILLATFDGAPGTTFEWKCLNDPVMGGQSHGTWHVNATDLFGTLDGEVVNVPKLKAPGFVTTAANGKFPDVSSTIGGDILINIRTNYSAYTGYRISVAAGTLAPEYACAAGGSLPLSGGCFKAHFSIPEGDFSTVRVAWDQFSDHWNPATGNITTTCADNPAYCITAQDLAQISRMEVWAEGVDGAFKLDIMSIGAGPKQVCNNTQYCCPDAKHCLTPTRTSCAADATVCATDQVCCPITKLCVDVGVPCVSPCADQGSYCCPDALHCLTPTNPGTLCKANSDCGSGGVCCPVTNECVKVGAACTPP